MKNQKPTQAMKPIPSSKQLFSLLTRLRTVKNAEGLSVPINTLHIFLNQYRYKLMESQPLANPDLDNGLIPKLIPPVRMINQNCIFYYHKPGMTDHGREKLQTIIKNLESQLRLIWTVLQIRLSRPDCRALTTKLLKLTIDTTLTTIDNCLATLSDCERQSSNTPNTQKYLQFDGLGKRGVDSAGLKERESKRAQLASDASEEETSESSEKTLGYYYDAEPETIAPPCPSWEKANSRYHMIEAEFRSWTASSQEAKALYEFAVNAWNMVSSTEAHEGALNFPRKP